MSLDTDDASLPVVAEPIGGLYREPTDPAAMSPAATLPTTVPIALRPVLHEAVRNGMSSTTQAGLDAFRRAVYEAELAAELLRDAQAIEQSPPLKRLLDSARVSALHLLVTADHVASGKPLRSPVIEKHAAPFGQRKAEEVEMRAKRLAAMPCHLWLRASGIPCAEPLRAVPGTIHAVAEEANARRRIARAEKKREVLRAAGLYRGRGRPKTPQPGAGA